MKGVQCYERFRGITLINHAFIYFSKFFMAISWSDAVSPVFCPVNSMVWVPVSIHGGLSGGVVVGLVSPKIFRQTSPAFHARGGGALPYPLCRCCMSRIYYRCPQ